MRSRAACSGSVVFTTFCRQYTDLPFEGEIPQELDGMVVLLQLLSFLPDVMLPARVFFRSQPAAVHAQRRQHAFRKHGQSAHV